jgi:hypothetical protein
LSWDERANAGHLSKNGNISGPPPLIVGFDLSQCGARADAA